MVRLQRTSSKGNSQGSSDTVGIKAVSAFLRKSSPRPVISAASSGWSPWDVAGSRHANRTRHVRGRKRGPVRWRTLRAEGWWTHRSSSGPAVRPGQRESRAVFYRHKSCKHGLGRLSGKGLFSVCPGVLRHACRIGSGRMPRAADGIEAASSELTWPPGVRSAVWNVRHGGGR